MPTQKKKQSLLYNAFYREIFFQILLVTAILLFFWFIAHNTLSNLEKRGIATAGFLPQPRAALSSTSCPTMRPKPADLCSGPPTILVSCVGAPAPLIALRWRFCFPKLADPKLLARVRNLP
jgi:hypothetical protein